MPEITTLLASLGYPDTEPFIGQRIQTLLLHPDARLLVAEQHGRYTVFCRCTLFRNWHWRVTFAVSAISVSVMMHVVRVSVRYWKYAQRNSPERAIATG
jgi:hypothetical protein